MPDSTSEIPVAPSGKVNRRSFLKRSAIVAAAGAAVVGAGSYWLGSRSRVSRSLGKKVIVIGIDGMDPVLSESMMKEGLLPNLAKLRASGGFSPLGTSIPPQSPVAWANFINGAGPWLAWNLRFHSPASARAMFALLLGFGGGARRRLLGSGRPQAAA